MRMTSARGNSDPAPRYIVWVLGHGSSGTLVGLTAWFQPGKSCHSPSSVASWLGACCEAALARVVHTGAMDVRQIKHDEGAESIVSRRRGRYCYIDFPIRKSSMKWLDEKVPF